MPLSNSTRLLLDGNKPVRIAVIGGGAGATEFVNRLLNVSGGRASLELSIYEPRERLGRGIAWECCTDSLIANMRLERLGPTYPEVKLIQQTLLEIGHSEGNSEYPSRNAMGMALDHRWKATLSRLPRRWSFRHVRHTVNNVVWDGNCAKLSHDGGDTDSHDLVVLAMGNIPARRDPRLPNATDGWDEAGIAAINAGSDILVRGAGLTAIDATIRLIEQGHPRRLGKIVWYSRSGELPYIRPRQIDVLVPEIITYEFIADQIDKARKSGRYVTLNWLKKLFECEIQAQLRGPSKNSFSKNTDFYSLNRIIKALGGPLEGLDFLRYGIANADKVSLWFSVAKLFDEYVIPLVWNAMSDQSKLEFLQKHRRTFDRMWAPIPKKNGERLLNWIEEGTLVVLRGNGADLTINPATGKAIAEGAEDALGAISRTELNQRYSSGFDAVIEATGISSELRLLDSELIDNMLASGLLRPYEISATDATGRRRSMSLGAQLDWYSGAIFDTKGQPHGWLYSLAGSLTTGAHRFTNSYLAVSASAHRVATAIFSPSI